MEEIFPPQDEKSELIPRSADAGTGAELLNEATTGENDDSLLETDHGLALIASAPSLREESASSAAIAPMSRTPSELSCKSFSSIDSDRMYASINRAPSNGSELEARLSSSIASSPDCVECQMSMDVAVSSTMEALTQMQMLFSESSHTPSGQREADGADDDASRGKGEGDSCSIRTVASIDAEEARLSEAEDAMRRELDSVDRMLAPLTLEEGLGHDLRYLNSSSEPKPYNSPNNGGRVQSTNAVSVSPSGVADWMDSSLRVSRTSSERGSTCWIHSDFVWLKSLHYSVILGDYPGSPIRAVAVTYVDKQTSVSVKRASRSSTHFAFNPVSALEPLANLMFGTPHEYKIRTFGFTMRSSVQTRTMEGTMCVASSLAVVLPTLLREMDIVGNVSETQFAALILLLPALLAALEAKSSHEIDETSIALGILFGGIVLEKKLSS